MSNRSSGRRRRGGRPSSTRGPNDGNRQSHRNSGNAHQLLDKYKNMARDSHQQGDRVMNEYYLQFADHYFRVLAEVNERKEDNRDRSDNRQSKNDNRQDSGRQDGNRNDSGSQQQQADEANSDKPKKSSAPKSGESRSGGSQPEEKRASPAKRTPKKSDRPDSDDARKDADSLKISADVLPGAVPVNGADPEMNGKSHAKKPAATRSRSKPKPSEGDGPSAEA